MDQVGTATELLKNFDTTITAMEGVCLARKSRGLATWVDHRQQFDDLKTARQPGQAFDENEMKRNGQKMFKGTDPFFPFLIVALQY
ncbi:MAG TPA: hypothetical protein EYP51_07810 [Thiotrichales bacterium]|nr:hypothetical protein [Thiotrichales bacterium]